MTSTSRPVAESYERLDILPTIATELLSRSKRPAWPRFNQRTRGPEM